MADQNESQNKWKYKYLELADQFEEKERDWEQSEKSLCRALGRVALISQGVDEQLDNSLDKLRKATQGGVDLSRVDAAVGAISERVQALEAQGGLAAESAGDNLPKPQEILMRLLVVTSLPESLSARADALSDKLSAFAEGDDIGPVINELADLIGEAVALTESSGNVVDLAELQNIFLEFLEGVSFPVAFRDRANAMKSTLLAGIGLEDIKSATQKIITLVVDLRTTLEKEKEELALYLKQLSSHLLELNAMAAGAEKYHHDSVAGTRELNEAVSAQIQDIESVVSGADNVADMKDAIHGSLTSIRSYFEERFKIDASREEELERQIKEMSRHVTEMESESQKLRERLEHERAQALIDPLTNIPNRLAYQNRSQQEYDRWKRYGAPLTMAVFDIDFFKRINDTYGHRAGDRALIVIAQTLNEHLRSTDFLARIGGEEFVLLLPETPLDAAYAVAEKLRISISECEFLYQGKPVPVSISGGIGQFRDADDMDSVFQRADQGLYRAKEGGRNRIEKEAD